MVVLGLILIGLGAVAILPALFTVEGSNVELLGTGISAMTLFFVGLGAGLALLWGFGLTKWGTKRSLRQRRESKQLEELHEKLEKHDAAQRRDPDHGTGGPY